ncbi:unnamed protein product [Urochloa decumbens]
MASLLLDKPREDWSEVHRSIGFGHDEGNTQLENTMKILSLSYYELPPHLRACLLYLSLFPEDHFIEKTPLIWMWIAEGFVHDKQGVSSFEIGEGYFNKLVNRSMIQHAKEYVRWNGDTVYGCRVHDMVLDLIRSISSEENFITRLLDGNKAGASSSSRTRQGKVRRLALQSDETVNAHMEDMKQVRSFSSYGFDIGSNGGVLLSSLKFARVLAIHTISPSQRITWRHLKPIQKLVHLRCLQLFGNHLELPEKEIATLKFLHTLDVINNGDCEQVMVASVGRLTQLRCLRIRNPIYRLPDGIGKLTSLEELEIYYEGSKQKASWSSSACPHAESASAWRRFINELGGLMELRVLRVGMPPKLPNHAQVHMMQSLHNLHKLKDLFVYVNYQMHVHTETWEEAEGGSLLLSRRLRQLFLPMLIFSRFPSFFLNASHLPILSHLRLYVERLNTQDLRILGKLPELHYLNLNVRSTVQLVCTTGATDDDDCLFRKLRHCKLNWNRVRLLSSKEGSGDISIRTGHLVGSMFLGSGKNKDVAPTLLPSVQELRLWMEVRDFNHFSLEYFASVNNVTVTTYCCGASGAEVEQVEAAVSHAADVHPNRPTLTMQRLGEAAMISAAQGQEGRRARRWRRRQRGHGVAHGAAGAAGYGGAGVGEPGPSTARSPAR